MKTVIILSCLLAVVLGEYTNKYDDINVKEILENKRLLDGYIKCIMDSGPCTPEGKELRSHIEEAITDGCGQCNEKQKASVEIVIRHLVDNEKEAWNQLCDKYDKTGKWRKHYEQLAKEHNIPI